MAHRSRFGNPALAVAYLRASTDDQRISPEAQRIAIEAWAACERVSVASWHVDQGVSGGSDVDARPGLVAALGELRARGAGVLVVAKRDRLARDVYVAATIERAAERCHARIVSADGTANGDTPADAFMRTILDGAAAYERALIRARTRAALAAKRGKGERIGCIPYGFELADDGVHTVACAAEQAVLSEVRSLRTEGLSMRAIVAALGARGFASRVGRPFALAQVQRMIASFDTARQAA